MIQLYIIKTGRGCGKNGKYCGLDEDIRIFADIKEAKEWLAKEYGKSKREKIYIDGKTGEPVHVGYCYCFNNADWSHSLVRKWRQQDWVRFYTLDDLNLEGEST